MSQKAYRSPLQNENADQVEERAGELVYAPPGTGDSVAWFRGEFARIAKSSANPKGVSKVEFAHRLAALGWDCGDNVVSMMTNSMQVPPERVPVVCKALGLNACETDQVYSMFAKAILPPEMADYVKRVEAQLLEAKTRLAQTAIRNAQT